MAERKLGIFCIKHETFFGSHPHSSRFIFFTEMKLISRKCIQPNHFDWSTVLVGRKNITKDDTQNILPTRRDISRLSWHKFNVWKLFFFSPWCMSRDLRAYLNSKTHCGYFEIVFIFTFVIILIYAVMWNKWLSKYRMDLIRFLASLQVIAEIIFLWILKMSVRVAWSDGNIEIDERVISRFSRQRNWLWRVRWLRVFISELLEKFQRIMKFVWNHFVFLIIQFS